MRQFSSSCTSFLLFAASSPISATSPAGQYCTLHYPEPAGDGWSAVASTILSLQAVAGQWLPSSPLAIITNFPVDR